MNRKTEFEFESFEGESIRCEANHTGKTMDGMGECNDFTYLTPFDESPISVGSTLTSS